MDYRCCNGNLLAYVEGNDVLLRLTVYDRTTDGDVAVDLDACDTAAARVIKERTKEQDNVETAIDGSEQGVMVVRLPRTLKPGRYSLEVTAERQGMQARSFDMRFAVVRRDHEASVPLTVIDGALTASLRVTMQVVPQAFVRGQNSYEMWKELPGNEDKTMQEYIDEVLDLNGLTSRLESAELRRVLAEKGREAAETNRQESESGRARAEATRQQNEEARELRETQRENAERDREQAEAARARAESDRERAFATAVVSVGNAVVAANTAAQNAKADYVGDDNYVYHWNEQTGAYERTNKYVKGDPGVTDYNELENTPDLSIYQQKENGKGLSANDYTDEDKALVNALRTMEELPDATIDGWFADE